MLGKEAVAALYSHTVLAPRRADLDVANADQTIDFVRASVPDVVIHCAAMARVDECEQNPEAAFRINAEGGANLATACRGAKCHLIAVSTDYVFDGEKGAPYHEFDAVNPINVYGRSKLEAERAIQRILPDAAIVRTAWLFGLGPCFAARAIQMAQEGQRMRFVDDKWGSPTYTVDLANQIAKIAENRLRGVFHIVNDGRATWKEVAEQAFKSMGLTHTVVGISKSEWPTPAERPTDTSLVSYRSGWNGLPPMRPWQDAMDDWASIFYQAG